MQSVINNIKILLFFAILNSSPSILFYFLVVFLCSAGKQASTHSTREQKALVAAAGLVLELEATPYLQSVSFKIAHPKVLLLVLAQSYERDFLFMVVLVRRP